MIGKRIIVFATVISYLSCFEIHLKELEDVSTNGEKETIYRLEVDQIRAKLTNRNGRTLRRSKLELIISGLESSFSWANLLQGENRLAVGFNLLQGKRYVDNVVLYTPRDGIYRVHGLKDNTQYFGTIRIIRDKNEIQQSNSSADSHQFRFDSPRIIQEKDKSRIREFLSKLAASKIRLDSSSVTFKLPNRIREHYILEVYNTNESSATPKTEIHIVPNSKTIILNDLPSNALMRMVLRRLNSTSSSDDATTAYLFTGSLTAGDQDTSNASSITRLVMYNKERLEQTQQQTTIHNEEKTVPCHVVNRRPFDGYPCPQSQVCLPLHWRCDGQQDCPGGLDEVNCDNYSLRAEILAVQEAKPCKVEEASCSANNVTMCLPNKWLCDGRQDCLDGWDEKHENCPPKITTYTIPSLTQGIRRITNLLLRCRGSFFRCRSGECISDQSVCDGVNHCDDASDELYCDNDEDDDEDDYEPDYAPEYEFRCHPRYEFKCYRSYSYSSRRCIPKAWLCDAFQDCPYGEDENTNFCSHQHLFRGYFE